MQTHDMNCIPVGSPKNCRQRSQSSTGYREPDLLRRQGSLARFAAWRHEQRCKARRWWVSLSWLFSGVGDNIITIAYRQANRGPASKLKCFFTLLNVSCLYLGAAMIAKQLRILPVSLQTYDIPAIGARSGSDSFTFRSCALVAEAGPVTGDGEHRVTARPSEGRPGKLICEAKRARLG